MKHNMFCTEMEKIARSSQRTRNMNSAISAAMGVGVGASTGYGVAKAIDKFNLFSTPKTGINARTALLLGVLSGGSAIMTHKVVKDYLYGKKRANRSKDNVNQNVLSSDQQLAERYEGHNNTIPTPLLYSDGSGPVPVYRRQGPIFDGDKRRSDRADNNGSGDHRYRYRGKKTRNYRFKDPVRIR